MKSIDTIIDEVFLGTIKAGYGTEDMLKDCMREMAYQVIDRCAEVAETKNEGTVSQYGYEDYWIVDKDSILKVKQEIL